MAALTGRGECLTYKATPAGQPGTFGGNRMIARNFAVLGAFAAAMLASVAAQAQLSDDVVKIGVLTDMNGPASTPTGQGSVTAAQMAVEDFGGKVLGQPVNVIVGDDQLKAHIVGPLARRWHDVRHNDLLLNGTRSTSQPAL